MVKTVPTNTVEMPPNKALAAGGSASVAGGIGSIFVGLALHYLAPDTPPEIAGLWNALANIIVGLLSGVIVYYMPHGALVKND